jgi:hypothetical protein
MSFASRKPVTLDDIDESLTSIVKILDVTVGRLNTQRDWLERIDSRLMAIEAAVSAVPEGENPLEEVLRALFRQADQQTQLLQQIQTALAQVLQNRQAAP